MDGLLVIVALLIIVDFVHDLKSGALRSPNNPTSILMGIALLVLGIVLFDIDFRFMDSGIN
jgi:hypothetical protein